MAIACGAALLAFAFNYVPAVGRGFIKDDFVWIATSRVSGVVDAIALFGTNTGFYRPLVSLSFAADYALWGLDPAGYGMTNLALAIVCAVLLFRLARALGLPAAAAFIAAAVWALNFHAVNMALLWLSGRTALLVTVFAVAAALAVLEDRRFLGGLLTLAAMLSKEEAVLLPALFTIFRFGDGEGVFRQRLGQALARTWPLWLAAMLYAVLRSGSGAYTPLDAPSYYQFSFAPVVILRNVVEYLDRACTTAAIAGLLLWLPIRERPRLAASERRSVEAGAIWIVLTYALTVFLPVRSSLYALLPSVGPALAVAALAAWARRTRPDAFAKVALVLAALAIALVPLYRARNNRWTALADLSTQVMGTLRHAALDRPQGGMVVLIESPAERFNLDATFGAMFPDAVALFLGPRWSGRIAPPGGALDADLVFRLSGGRLSPVDAPVR